MNKRKTIRVKDSYDKMDEKGNWLKTYNQPTGIPLLYQRHTTLSGERWGSILRRTKAGDDRPTYNGCVNLFTSFSHFVDWSRSQVGYDKREANGYAWALDKDILGDGKSYSPEFCMFVPQEVNNFLTLRGRLRGDQPIGVTYIERGEKYYYCSKANMGDHVASKVCYSSEDAHRFWQEHKIIRAEQLIEKYKSEHFRLAHGLMSLAVEIREDLSNGRETIW